MAPYGSEAVCPATDNFCFVVKAFDRGIVNGQFEITEDVFLMPAYHPGNQGVIKESNLRLTLKENLDES